MENPGAFACLVSLLGNGHVYVENFKEKIDEGYQTTVNAGIGILKATREDIAAGHLAKGSEQSPLLLIEQICLRFHCIARQLRSRHAGRATLDVQDEYDLQDLMHALLSLHFIDIRPEEYTPSYAGKASRMDFLLKQESIVIELKMTRDGLAPKDLTTQLIEDIERYKTHPNCQALVCFVYDPGGLIPNPRGIEADLNRDDGPFPGARSDTTVRWLCRTNRSSSPAMLLTVPCPSASTPRETAAERGLSASWSWRFLTTMDKEHIIGEIRRTAKTNGGVPLGWRRL